MVSPSETLQPHFACFICSYKSYNLLREEVLLCRFATNILVSSRIATLMFPEKVKIFPLSPGERTACSTTFVTALPHLFSLSVLPLKIQYLCFSPVEKNPKSSQTDRNIEDPQKLCGSTQDKKLAEYLHGMQMAMKSYLTLKKILQNTSLKEKKEEKERSKKMLGS